MSHSSAYYPNSLYRSSSSLHLSENSRVFSDSFHQITNEGLAHSYSTSNHMAFASSRIEESSSSTAAYRHVPAMHADQYKLNLDPNPTVIRRKPLERIQHVQSVKLTYLKPPPAPQPGDLLIVQEPDVQIPAAAPLHITEKPNAAPSPAPLVLREKPPASPPIIPAKHVHIPGKVLAPPPRQVIVERLPQMPPKPQDIIVERWLGYQRRTRNVNFRPAAPIVPLSTPKNILIQWESPQVDVRQDFQYVGVRHADPRQYLHNVEASHLPVEARHFQVPAGERLAVDVDSQELPMLVGDVDALRRIDLKCHGLSAYAPQVYKRNYSTKNEY